MIYDFMLADTPGFRVALAVAGADPWAQRASGLLQDHNRVPGKRFWGLPAKGYVDAIGLVAGPPVYLPAEAARYRRWRFDLVLSVIDPRALDGPGQARYGGFDLAIIAGTTTPQGLAEALRWAERLLVDQRSVRAASAAGPGLHRLAEVPVAFVLDDTVPGAGPRPDRIRGLVAHPLTASGVQRAYHDAVAQVRQAIEADGASLVARVPGGAARPHLAAFRDDPIARDLYQAILDQPFLDAPRQALGDLLHGRGDPRGELIALQLRLAAEHRRGVTSAESASILERARALYQEHKAAWQADLVGWCKGASFGRGFVERITISPADWLDGHEVILARAPVIAITIDRADRFAELAGHPSLRRVVALSAAGVPIGDAGALAIAGSPFLRQLRLLDLVGAGVGAAGRAAVASPDLAELRWVGLDGPSAQLARPSLAAVLPVVD